jgi:hypothetical protein
MPKTSIEPLHDLYRGFLKALLGALTLSSLISYTSAHGVNSSDLKGEPLCLEPRSVQVSRRGDSLPEDVYFQTVAERLYRVLTTTRALSPSRPKRQ